MLVNYAAVVIALQLIAKLVSVLRIPHLQIDVAKSIRLRRHHQQGQHIAPQQQHRHHLIVIITEVVDTLLVEQHAAV